MNSPFKFGNLVTGPYFINRTEEVNRLRNNFQSGNNTILISPRRWGKSSLVAQSAESITDKKIRQFFDALPKSFQRKEAVTIGKGIKVLERTVDKYLATLMNGSLLTQPEYGQYEKA